MTTAVDPKDVLAKFKIPGACNWYSIGYGESRVTVRTQQVRAFNLAWALRETRTVGKRPVLVIGGGAAGLAVAAGLADGGVPVTVLERESALLPLQRNCRKRHLHPHVFDWPEEMSDNTRSDLPLLDWRAGMACDVARAIEAGFLELVETSNGAMDYRCHVQDLSLDTPNRGTITFWNARERKREDLSYDVLIFALGFGVENSFWMGSRGSYWADDSLEQHGVVPEGKYLVSGVGDGGFIDTFRLLLPEVKQAELARIVRPDLGWLRKELEAIQSAALDAGRPFRNRGDLDEASTAEGSTLWEGYRNIAARATALDERLLSRLNRKVSVTLIAKHRSVFSLRTQPLHRLLLSRLLFRAGDSLAVRCQFALEAGMLRHDGNSVLLEGPMGSERFVHAIVRHGPEKLSAYRAFPEVVKLLTGVPAPILSEHPYYRPNYFGDQNTAFRGGGGPDEEDYLDELRGRSFSISTIGGARVLLSRFNDTAIELRELAEVDEEREPSSDPTPGVESQGVAMQKHRDDEQNNNESEAKQRHRSRLWDRRIGISVELGSVLRELHAPVLIRGEAGTGKTTLLKHIAAGALRAFESDNTQPFPFFVGSPPQLDVWGDDTVTALVEACLLTAEISNYSAAARRLRARLEQRNVLVLIDTVESWRPDVFREVVHWLVGNGIRFYIVGRAFPLKPQALGLGKLRALEIVGLTPASTRRFLERQLHGQTDAVDLASRQLDALESIPNTANWRRTPFLLVEFANAFGILVGRKDVGAIDLYFARLAQLFDGVDTATKDEIQKLAQRTLCAIPSRFSFGKGEIAPKHLADARRTHMFTGNQRLEFVHLTFGEYLAAATLADDDLADARRELGEERPGRADTWHHQLEILPMAHCLGVSRLQAAFVAAKADDRQNRLLSLVLRAVGYGGAEVHTFCLTQGGAVVEEVFKRLTSPNARFAESERELCRYAARAVPYLRRGLVAPKSALGPGVGEPGAEAWVLLSLLGVGDEGRPRESAWWSTIYHEAQALVEAGASIEAVVRETIGASDPDEEAAALAALEDWEQARSLLTADDERARLNGFGSKLRSPRLLGLLADSSERIRREALTFALEQVHSSSAAKALIAASLLDPGAAVRAVAVSASQDDERTRGMLLHELKALLEPRRTIGFWKKQLLTALLKKTGSSEEAELLTAEFLSEGRGWFCDQEQFALMLNTPRNVEILRERITSGEASYTELRAAGSFDALRPAVRASLHAHVVNQEWDKAAAAMAGLPPNEQETRQDRLACLALADVPIPKSDRHKREVVRAAIGSLVSDPEAATLLTPFLQLESDPDLADDALKVVGSEPSVREMLWPIVRTENLDWNNAQFTAIDALGADASQHAALRARFLEITNSTSEPRRWMTRDYYRARLLKTFIKEEESSRLKQFIGDPDDPVREVVIHELLDRNECLDELEEHAIRETSRPARKRLWERFVDQEAFRERLKVRARPNLWAIRRAFFALASENEDRLPELRQFFERLVSTGEMPEMLPELVAPLARDHDARRLLRSLATRYAPRLVSTLLDVLKDDDEMRLNVRGLLPDRDWRQQFFMSSTLEDYFRGDPEAQLIVLRQLQETYDRGVEYLPMLGECPLEILEGFGPARDLVKTIALHEDADINAANAARAITLDDPDVRKRVLADLTSDSEESTVINSAARLLADDQEALPLLARLQDSSTKATRKIAYSAALRLGERPKPLLGPRKAERQPQEDDEELRRILVDGIDLVRWHASERTELLRAYLVDDYDWHVRQSAGEKLSRAEPALPLRAHDSFRHGLLSPGLRDFLGNSAELRESDDSVLFGAAVMWLVAKLVAPLRESNWEAALTSIAPAEETFGELLDDHGLEVETTIVRLAQDAFWLQRDRDIWPTANVVFAWLVAERLVAVKPKTILLACADVDSDDLIAVLPNLDPGQVKIGPTFFGFRLREQ